jgi:hypothetical protein
MVAAYRYVDLENAAQSQLELSWECVGPDPGPLPEEFTNLWSKVVDSASQSMPSLDKTSQHYPHQALPRDNPLHNARPY